MIDWEDVVTSLENKKYKWRTVRGVAKELNVTTEDILKTFAEHENEIIKSSIPAESGEDLYTTRRHYKKTSSLIDKVLTSITGTVTSSSTSSALDSSLSYDESSGNNFDKE